MDVFARGNTYTVDAIDEMRKRIEPAIPAEVPSANWSFAVSVTMVIAAPSVQPIKKTPSETSTEARTFVPTPQVAMEPKQMAPRVMPTTHCHFRYPIFLPEKPKRHSG